MAESLLIVTPTFGAEGSGAATYYRLLVRMLAPVVDDVTVLSEATPPPAEFAGRYLGALPVRSSRDRQPLRDVARYALQNAAYVRLPGLVRRSGATRVLVHTSFLNLPGVFPQVLARLAGLQRRGLRIVADARDALLPDARVATLNRFDAVIACSENVTEHLERHGVHPARIHPIPVPQERLTPTGAAWRSRRERLGVPAGRTVFFAGLLKESKAVDLLLQAFTEGVAPAEPDVTLVLAGLVKSRHPGIVRGLRHPSVRHLGNLGRDDVLAVMAGADLCVNLSPVEGLPRSSLEALALGRPVILPPNVPEFARYCAEDVATTRVPSEVAAMILERLRKPRRSRYPIELHEPDALLPRYRSALALSDPAPGATR